MDETQISFSIPGKVSELCIIYQKEVGSTAIKSIHDDFDGLLLAKEFVTAWEAEHGPITPKVEIPEVEIPPL